MNAVTATGSVSSSYVLHGNIEPTGVLKGTIKTTGVLSGSVKAACLTGYIKSAGTLQGVMVASGFLKGQAVVPVLADHDKYTGSYVVRPALADQTLETINKLMVDNMTVQAIPYDEVSNIDGTTVIIGGVDIG